MEPKQYVAIVLRWYWLILLGLGVGGVASYFTYSGEGTTYTAEATLFIGGSIFSPNPNESQFQIGSALALIYSEMVRYDDILNGVIDRLDMDYSTNQLRRQVSAYQQLEGTPLLVIQAELDDRDLAIDVANSIAEQVILESPTNLTPEEQASIDLARGQIDALQVRYNSILEQIEELDEQINAIVLAQDNSADPEATQEPGSSAANEAELQRLLLLRGDLNTQVSSISDTIAQFSSQIINTQQRLNTLTLIQPATRASVNAPRSRRATVVIWTAAGGILATVLVLLLEYFNTNIRNTKDVVENLGVPVIGTIPRFGRAYRKGPQHLVEQQATGGKVIEGYRALEANLIFSTGKRDKKRQVYLVASPNKRDGRTATAVNLAVTMALDNLRVLLVDGDLRRPSIHTKFNYENIKGLTSFARNAGEAETAPLNGKDSLHGAVHETEIPNLFVVTSGEPPTNPVYFLNSFSLPDTIKSLQQEFDLDVVIIDTPPSLSVSDSTIMAAAVNAHVIIVFAAGRISAAVGAKAVNQFNRVGSVVRGVVLNRVSSRDVDHGHGYDVADAKEPFVEMPERAALPEETI